MLATNLDIKQMLCFSIQPKIILNICKTKKNYENFVQETRSEILNRTGWNFEMLEVKISYLTLLYT